MDTEREKEGEELGALVEKIKQSAWRAFGRVEADPLIDQLEAGIRALQEHDTMMIQVAQIETERADRLLAERDAQQQQIEELEGVRGEAERSLWMLNRAVALIAAQSRYSADEVRTSIYEDWKRQEPKK